MASVATALPMWHRANKSGLLWGKQSPVFYRRESFYMQMLSWGFRFGLSKAPSAQACKSVWWLFRLACAWQVLKQRCWSDCTCGVQLKNTCEIHAANSLHIHTHTHTLCQPDTSKCIWLWCILFKLQLKILRGVFVQEGSCFKLGKKTVQLGVTSWIS